MGKTVRYVTSVISLAVCTALNPASAAQDNRGITVKTDRLALVIGNAAYPTAPLKNPVNDAEDIGKSLSAIGFKVALHRNADKRTMEEAIRNFGRQLKGGAVGVFYFAGHGMQVEGQNYLIPVNAKIESESDIRYEAVDASLLLGKMEDAGNSLNIVILDACRNNPFSRNFRNAAAGLARMDAPTGSLIAYSTAPGSVAADGADRNGVFTKHFIRHLATPNLTVEQVLKRVRVDVAQETNQRQIPWESSSLMGEFFFNVAPSAAPAQALRSGGRFDGAWDVVVECPDVTEGTSFAKGYILRFTAEVREGALSGQHRNRGEPGSLTVAGRIQPDGTAELKANGVTDGPGYTLKQVVRGTPYAYRVSARFEDVRGSGNRIEERPCKYSFSKK